MEKGKWVVFWDSGIVSRRIYREPMQIAKVTDKLVKFVSTSWPRQCARDDVIAVFDTEAVGAAAIEAAVAAKASFADKIKAIEDQLVETRRASVQAMIDAIKR